jgi:hypothetical protein
MQGPFPIKFDPEAALLREQRKILDMTATSWVAFREFACSSTTRTCCRIAARFARCGSASTTRCRTKS